MPFLVHYVLLMIHESKLFKNPFSLSLSLSPSLQKLLMNSCSLKTSSLASLTVFRNVLNQELIRSIHVYRLENGNEFSVEREFMFSPNSYIQMNPHPVNSSLSGRNPVKFPAKGLSEGQQIGLWLCILLFNADLPPLSTPIPSILTLSRNPRLKSIPELANDLEKVIQLRCTPEIEEIEKFGPVDACTESQNNYIPIHSDRTMPVIHSNYCSFPCPNLRQVSSRTDQMVPELAARTIKNRKKRAATKHVASISLTDLAKYFDLPIAEASRNLEVGITVLKKKCRELGIPRWPHRKIRSLDSLIHNLQEEANRQERENKVAAMAVTKRQRMLEREKEGIEKKPFMEILSETKRFRQDVFKRRHRARVLNKKNQNP